MESIVGIFITMIPSVFAFFDLSDPRSVIEDVIQGIKDVGTPIFSTLFGIYQSDEFLFVKALLFILLFIIIRVGVSAVPKLGDQKGVVNIVALVVSLIAVRFISENDITKGILLPYGTLGVALATLIPFLIYFFFVEKTISSGIGRKMAWLLFIVIFTFIWILRISSPGELSNVANYMYLSVIALGVILFLFDRHVKKYFDMRANYDHTRNVLERRIALLQSDYDRIASVDSDAARNQRKILLRQIKEAEEDKHKL